MASLTEYIVNNIRLDWLKKKLKITISAMNEPIIAFTQSDLGVTQLNTTLEPWWDLKPVKTTHIHLPKGHTELQYVLGQDNI